MIIRFRYHHNFLLGQMFIRRVREVSKSLPVQQAGMGMCGRKDSIEAFQFRSAPSLGTELPARAVAIESCASISTAFSRINNTSNRAGSRAAGLSSIFPRQQFSFIRRDPVVGTKKWTRAKSNKRNIMKWFHHECAARHDPKLQVLGSTHGAEGVGLFWALLEEIGQHSDTFHLKIIGINREADERFSDFLRYPTITSESPFEDCDFIAHVPRLPVKLLAKNLFTSQKKLQTVIAFCVEISLFDYRKWVEYNVLYSSSFEKRADDYTRRIKRASHTVRTASRHCSDNIHTTSEQGAKPLQTVSELNPENVSLEADTETEGNEKDNRSRAERTMLLKNVQSVKTPISQLDEEMSVGYIIEPNEELFDEYALRFHAIIQRWNRENPANDLNWQPATIELKKLFVGGEYEHKLSMCFHAFKLLGEKINYPELVLRGLRLMLKANTRAKIDNPFGWLWTCLHGGGGAGTKPWVQLLTSEEENSPLKRT